MRKMVRKINMYVSWRLSDGNGSDITCPIAFGETHSHFTAYRGLWAPLAPVPAGSRCHQLFPFSKREMANLKIAEVRRRSGLPEFGEISIGVLPSC